MFGNIRLNSSFSCGVRSSSPLSDSWKSESTSHQSHLMRGLASRYVRIALSCAPVVSATPRDSQRCETTAEAFATTLIQALGCSGVGGALAREAVRTTPASFQRTALGAALGAALDDDGRVSNGKASTSRVNKVKVECLAPGLVCLRKFLSVEQQEWFSRACFDLGETNGESGQGFFEKDAEDGTCRL